MNTRYDYPYCPHGMYVGGSGADYMCGACECGDLPPTLRELHQQLREAEAELDRQVANLEAICVPNLTHMFRLIATYPGGVINTLYRRIATQKLFIDQVRPWSHGGNDRQWLNRRHDQAVKDYYAEQEAEGEEFDPYADLPASVLDGGY